MTAPEDVFVLVPTKDYEALLAKARKWSVLEEILPEVTDMIKDLVALSLEDPETMPN